LEQSLYIGEQMLLLGGENSIRNANRFVGYNVDKLE